MVVIEMQSSSGRNATEWRKRIIGTENEDCAFMSNIRFHITLIYQGSQEPFELVELIA